MCVRYMQSSTLVKRVSARRYTPGEQAPIEQLDNHVLLQ